MLKTFMGRFSTPEDLGNAACFLCSDEASMINGVALEVDGGAASGWEPVGLGERGLQIDRSGPFLSASWPMAVAMSRRISQKLSSLGLILAPPHSVNASTPQARQAPVVWELQRADHFVLPAAVLAQRARAAGRSARR